MRRLLSATIVIALLALASLARADTLPTAPGNHDESIKSGGRERTFVLHLPPTFDGRSKVPVVIMIHGAGGTGLGAIRETGWDQMADREGFIAVFPDGTPAQPNGSANFLLNPRLWNDGSGRGAIGRDQIDDIAFFSALIDFLEQNYNADPNRIFVTGFSNGASMTWRIGAALSSRVAAIAPVSGHLWLADVKPAAPIPVLFIIGTNDPLNPIAGGNVTLPWGGSDYHPPIEDSLAVWRKAAGCSGKPRIARDSDGVHESVWDGCTLGLLDYITIDGQGHIWPGGHNELPARWVGQPTNHLDATSTIWEFFKSHPKTAR